MSNLRCHIKLPQHHALICVDDDHIRVFKYDSACCEWETFTAEESFEASDWICKCPTTSAYTVTITDT